MGLPEFMQRVDANATHHKVPKRLSVDNNISEQCEGHPDCRQFRLPAIDLDQAGSRYPAGWLASCNAWKSK
jgi:hypothetical protein